MSRRLQAIAATVVATGALGGAALAHAATPSAKTTRPAATPSASPAPGHRGPCPNMGGGGSAAPGDSGSSSGST